VNFERVGSLYLPEPPPVPLPPPEPVAVLSHERAPGDDCECTVGHQDESRGGCYTCMHCRQYVRPHKMGEACPARAKKVVIRGQTAVRVRIEGTYLGRKWVYEDEPERKGSQFLWPGDEEGNPDLSEYWWSEGNMGCDCNRYVFLPDDLKAEYDKLHPRAEDDWEGFGTCGETIRIDSIIPLDPDLAEKYALYLNESP
jgi:hypothetical protein